MHIISIAYVSVALVRDCGSIQT